MAALQTGLYAPLKQEGLKRMEFWAIVAPGATWDDRAPGFNTPTYPVSVDPSLGVFYLYGASDYDLYLIDKRGRMVTKEVSYSPFRADQVRSRLRQLHAE